MANRARGTVVPAYLIVCLILGGSAQGIWQNMVLQLAGLAIIAWAALGNGEEPLPPAARRFLLLGILAIVVVALQLVPLPPSVWPHLGPRTTVAAGFRTLGLPVPPEPLSLTPAASLDTLLKLIPPLAIFCGIVRLKAYRSEWLGATLVAGTVVGVALGSLQVASFRPESAEQSRWYLYDDTNLGKCVGFFANADHMATLLIITIPFLAAIVGVGKRASMQHYSAILALSVGLGIVVLVGLGLNGSLAGYGLALPVIAASALIVAPSRSRVRLWIAGATALLLIGSVTALEVTPIGSRTLGEHAALSVQSRAQILSTTSKAIRDFMPFGSGLGSFQSVYPLYERPDQVTSTFVVHAHNDYTEIALELGLAGIILILLFLAWWAIAVWRAWQTAEGGPFTRAAAIASAAILIHSLVDFPLRTAAISACLAMCLALLVKQSQSRVEEPTELRPARHLRI